MMRNLVSVITRFFRVHGFRAVFLLITEAERRISSRLIGVPAGFLEQFHGNLVRLYFAMNAPVSKDLMLRGQEIRRNGVEILEEIIDPAIVDKIYSVFEQRVNAGHSTVTKTVVQGQTASEAIEFKFDDPDLPSAKAVMTQPVIGALRATLGKL